MDLTQTQHSDVISTNTVISDHLRHEVSRVDYNFRDKTRGHLVHQPTQFEFIGPDTEPRKFSKAEEFINIAQIIKNTGVSNYKQARFPVESGLNIEAWENRLINYPLAVERDVKPQL